ncbi:amidohydrolase family protein [Roseburia hominis]
MIIDAHIHPFKQIPADWVNGAKGAKKEWYQNVDLSMEGMIHALDEGGVDKGILLGLKTAKFTISNEEIADFCKKSNGRFIGFAAVDPTEGEKAIEEMEYAIKVLGLKGIGEITPPTQFFYPNDESLYPFYECAEKLGVPVVIHTGGENGGLIKYSNPIYLDEVASRFKNLTIIAEHMGSFPFGMWFKEAMNVAWKNPNVYVGIAALKEIELVDMDLLTKAVKYIGADKILFGTDYPTEPLCNIKYHVDLVMNNSKISDSDKEKIMGENMWNLIK